MSEQPVRTRVRTADGWRSLQEFLILDRGEGPVEAIELDGVTEAQPTPEVLAAIEGADAIVIGPSNPVISIGPILSLPALREAIADSPAPVVAVSPYVAGRVVKGPTDVFMRAIGRSTTAAGVASLYEGVIEGMVCDIEDPDPPPDRLETLSAPTLMRDAHDRRELAERTLELAAALRDA